MTSPATPPNRPLLFTRRELLHAGVCGSLALTVSGFAGRWAATPAAAQAAAQAGGYTVLSKEGATILRAIAPVILDGCLPADPAAQQQAIAGMLADIDGYMAYLPPAVLTEALDGFRLLHFAPFRALIGGLWRDYPNATPDALADFLRGFRDSRFQLLRSTYAFLQSIVVVAWFDRPAAWAMMGYDGPVDTSGAPEASAA